MAAQRRTRRAGPGARGRGELRLRQGDELRSAVRRKGRASGFRPGNLAFTSRAIRPHTDNPYRDPAPTVQLLHCLRAAGEGGDTGLVDGFAAAADFRAADPESFGTLARTPVSFGYVDKETELRASLPLIQLSPSGRVRGVRFNNRSMRPLRRPYAEVTAFYAAYRRWAELLAQPVKGMGRWVGAHRTAGARGLPGLRQHPGAARPHRLQHEPALARVAPARLLRRPGRPGQHPGRTDTKGEPMSGIEMIADLFARAGRAGERVDRD